MPITVVSGRSESIDPVSHLPVYSANSHISLSDSLQGPTILSADISRHLSAGGSSQTATFVFGSGPGAVTQHVTLSSPAMSLPSSVAGGIAQQSVLDALRGVQAGGITGMAIRASMAAFTNSAPNTGSAIDMHDGTHINLLNFLHH